jgi:amino acid adenylation domain-containing protein
MKEREPRDSRNLSQSRQLLLEKRRRGEYTQIPESRAASPLGSRPERLPLSFAQSRLWFLHRLSGPDAGYNVPLALRLEGPLDRASLEAALNDLVGRHESLRTIFSDGPDGPYQTILGPSAAPLILSVADADQASVPALLEQAGRHRFDLAREIPLRIWLFQLAPDRHVLLLLMHHIAADAGSLGPLQRDLATAYGARVRGQGPTFPPLPLQYADYALWQRDQLGDPDDGGSAIARQMAYWRGALAGMPEELDLPRACPRTSIETFRADTVTFRLAPDLHGHLLILAQRTQASFYMIVQAALAVLLTRLGTNVDIPIGGPISGRTEERLEGLVGLFLNALVFRTDTSGHPSVRELLERVRQSNLAAYANQDLPFELLVETLNPPRVSNRHPLVQVALTLQGDEIKGFELPGLKVTPEPVPGHHAKFDLSFHLAPERDAQGGARGVRAVVTYVADLFSRASVVGMTRRLIRIFEAVVAEPERSIDTIDVLEPEERQQILCEWNREVSLRERCVHEVFEEQAERTPDAVAIVCGEQAISYRELNRRANQLAHYLRERGVGPDTRVATCLERGAELIVVFLGVLKAGGCYVPLDPTYPSERLRWMVTDSAPAVVLTSSEWADVFAGHIDVPVLDVADAPWHAMPAANLPASSLGLTPRHLAYVLYTSGSTGMPKGVMVDHCAVQRLVATDNGFATFDLSSKVAFASNPVFDATTLEIWAPLLNGGCLVVIDRHTLLDPDRFGDALTDHRVTILWLTVGLFNQYVDILAEQFQRLVYLIVGGDALDPRAIARMLQHGGPQHLLNGYGPTETTTFALTHEIIAVSDSTRSIPIGRPIGHTRVYVLDGRGALAPVGVTGELYIGGAGVARGYLNQPMLTAERFMPDPFVADATARMYRTGDLGTWQPDGTIEFRGRRDFQLKLRGFRIELGEIEAQLAQQPGVRDVVVVARHEGEEDKRLVAYYTTRETDVTPDAETLRAALSATLPAYMIPAAYVRLPAFPLTPNGKLDRTALPQPAADAYAMRGFEAPVGEIETTLAAIWGDLLHVAQVGRHDNFFELGGHSLLALRAVTRAQQELGVALGIDDLFARPVLADLARSLAQAAASALPPIAPAVRGETAPLSFAQQRLWFLAQMDGASEAYHVVQGLRLHGPLQRDALVAALNRIVWRHEVLRTTFASYEGEATQQITPADESRFELVEDAWPEDADQAALERLVAEESSAPFDLVRGPLIRGRLIRQAADRHVLLIAMHHIVSDGWSTSIFLSELSTLYGAFVRGESDPLPALALQYADYAIWQRQSLDGEVLQRQAAYWQTTLRDAPALLELPTDRARSAVQDFAGDRVGLVLAPELTAGLKALSQQHGCTLYMTLLAAWAAVLGRLASQTDVVIGTPAANRHRAEIEGLIGFFINTLALRIDLAGTLTVGELLARVKQQAVGAQQHQDLPFEQIVELVQPTRSLSHSPLLQVTFTWQNIPRGAADLVGLDVQPLGVAGIRPTSKYDLMLGLQESGDRIVGGVAYATALFERPTIERYLTYFHHLLEGMVAGAQQVVDRLPLLCDDERARILYEWNRSAEAHPREQCIHELFEAQAARTPGAVAVVCGERTLTYEALNQQANQLAHDLRAQGVGPETPVATCLERSVELVVALLAALKAGGCYVPLDPTYPRERLRWMVADSAPAVLLTSSDRADLLADRTPVVVLDAPTATWRTMPATNPPPTPGLTARHLAYVLYTSGSTGTPKGVMVDHRAVQRLVARNNGYAAFDVSDKVAFASNPSFDATTLELWAPLLNGGCLVVIDQPTLLDPARFGEALTRHGVTILWLTVGLFNQYVDELADAFGRLVYLIVGGDVLDPRAIARLQQRGGPQHLLNGYGPTETTTFALTHDITAVSDGTRSIPVGRPIADRRVYILDTHGSPVPVGVTGELYIGGAGVARGYLNQPVLTAERFLPDPFVADAPARMYRTGDLGRWQADGTIEFLGRRDLQLKLRGFRIELGEIEFQLKSSPAVKDALVMMREDRPGDQRLTGYVRPDWARLEAMSGEEALRNALADPDSQPPTPEQLSRLRRVPNPQAILPAMGLTQEQFAHRFEIALNTLRAWEEHRLIPDSTAKAYLRVIERNPDAVIDALNSPSLVPTRASE